MKRAPLKTKLPRGVTNKLIAKRFFYLDDSVKTLASYYKCYPYVIEYAIRTYVKVENN